MIEYIKGFEFKVLKLIPETHELEYLILGNYWDIRIPEKDLDSETKTPLYEQANIYKLKDFLRKFRPDLYQKYRLLIE